MSVTVRTRIIKIGNSQGIRIPKLLLNQVGLWVEVEIEAQEKQLMIRSVRSPRQGWDERFEEITAHDDDRLLDGDLLVPTQWEDAEWEW